MDQIERFLQTLHDNSPDQFKGVAQKALDVYRGRKELTERQHAWALKAAGAQRTEVPAAFYTLRTFQPKGTAYPVQQAAPHSDHIVVPQQSVGPYSPGVPTRDLLLAAAQALIALAERL